ncbi:MAG TPA: hypothetical protein P5181_10335 [Dermatophilaceae bacterium]|nr:hypothetical protein [Dermatophilaceae bacterium]HRW19232.1 hypothetical protein [Dermatophilaceae bacterium]
MASTLKGMDTEAGRASAKTLKAGADQLDQLTQNLTKSITTFAWQGADSVRTREQWNNGNVRILQGVASQLREFATLIEKQAAEQDAVSN